YQALDDAPLIPLALIQEGTHVPHGIRPIRLLRQAGAGRPWGNARWPGPPGHVRSSADRSGRRGARQPPPRHRARRGAPPQRGAASARWSVSAAWCRASTVAPRAPVVVDRAYDSAAQGVLRQTGAAWACGGAACQPSAVALRAARVVASIPAV